MRANFSAFLACILMMGVAIALLVGFSAAYFNLGESAAVTYEKLAFEDLNVDLRLVAPTVTDRVRALPQVAAAEGRRANAIRIVLPGGEETSGLAIGIPWDRPLTVNKLHIDSGSPLQTMRGEALLERRFAEYHGYKLGDMIRIEHFEERRRYRIVGLVSSPEYVWLTPDRLDPRPAARRFGVMFLSHEEMASLTYWPVLNQMHIRVRPNANLESARQAVSHALEGERDGEVRTRAEQPSYALLERDRQAFAGVASLFPLTLLTLSGTMLFLTLWQLLHTQRKQIGILLCQGLSPAWVAGQYTLLAMMVGVLSALLGTLLGPPLALVSTRYYVASLGVPYLVSEVPWLSLLLGWGAALGISLLAAFMALRHMLKMKPLDLLRAEFSAGAGLPKLISWLPLRFSYRTLFPLRNLLRQPWRSLTMVAGVALANGLLLMTLALLDSHLSMLDFYLTRVHRYDLEVDMQNITAPADIPPIELWPGVQRVEKVLRVGGTLLHDGKRLERGMWGLPNDSQLLQLFDLNGNPLQPRRGAGVLLAPLQRRLLDAHAGDQLNFEIPDGYRRPSLHPVSMGVPLYEPIQGPIKIERSELQAMLNRAHGTPMSAINVLLLKVDPKRLLEIRHRLYADSRVKDVTTLTDLRADIDDMMRLIMAFLSLMLGCAGLIALALVHACTTMNLSERKGEVACMLVQGVRQKDLFHLLLLETLYLWMVGLLIGVPAGYFGGDWLLSHFQSDLMDLRLDLKTTTMLKTAVAGLVVTLLASVRAIVQLIHIPLGEATRSPD